MLPVVGQASGGFAAGFLGTNAATTATSSFVSGALIGGGARLAGGFTTGFGNALIDGKNLGQALGQGGIYGAIGMGSGALIGGLVGGINAARNGRTFWRGGTIAKEPLAYDYSFDGIPLNEQTGKYGCVDNAIDNVSVSENLDVCGVDVRYNLENGGSPLTNGISDKEAVSKYAEMTGRKYTGLTGINEGNMNDLYHSIGNSKVLISYPSSGMNHMVNMQGAYRQIITYPSGSTSLRIMYYVLDNGRQIVRPASFFVNKSTSFFRIFTP
jgi:hypothetical protein